MTAPVVVAITDDFAAMTAAHLQGQGFDIAPSDVRAALDAAARFEDATPQPGLFGDRS